MEQYRNKLREEPLDMDVEDYVRTGGEQGEELLKELAEKGYMEEMHKEHLEHVQDLVADRDYIQISINLASLLVDEDKEKYVVKMPRGRTGATFDHVMYVDKKDAILLDDGQTLITAVKADEKIPQYSFSNGVVQTNNPLEMEGKKFCEAFAPVEKERLKRVAKLKPDKADSFPSFTKLSPTEQLANILHIEQLKERINNPEYIPVSFDMAQMVAEDRNVYVANLTEYMDEKAEVVRCMTIDKSDAHVSEDGMRLLAYLKKSGESNIMEYNGEGQKLREFKVKNEKLAGDVLKRQMERSKTEKIPIQEIAKEIGKATKR